VEAREIPREHDLFRVFCDRAFFIKKSIILSIGSPIMHLPDVITLAIACEDILRMGIDRDQKPLLRDFHFNLWSLIENRTIEKLLSFLIKSYVFGSSVRK
jgi:hypothetical protein